MEFLNPTAENVEIDLRTSAISDPPPEITAPAKQAGKSGRAKAPTPAPAPKKDSDGNEVPVNQTLADYIVLKITGNDPVYKADFEKSQFITALRLNQACDQQIKGINSQLRGFALKLARELETVSPNPNPIQSYMIIIPRAFLDYMGYIGIRGNSEGCLLYDLDYMGFTGTRGNSEGCLLCDPDYMGYQGTRGN